ncbi:hypothetical protein D3C71_1225180 [compost metagenome]
MQVYFVYWRKKRYEESLLAMLDTMMTNPGHPAGMFWIWKYTYDAKGKQHTARDSAKSAKYNPIQDVNIMQTWASLVEAAEAKAAAFTTMKAAEVVVANHFLYMEDLQVETAKYSANTIRLIDASKASSALGVPGLPAGAQPGTLPVGQGFNPLQNFSLSGQAPVSLGGDPNQGQQQGGTFNPQQYVQGQQPAQGQQQAQPQAQPAGAFNPQQFAQNPQQ